MCLEVDHVTQMCTNMAGINSMTSRENDLFFLCSPLAPAITVRHALFGFISDELLFVPRVLLSSVLT